MTFYAGPVNTADLIGTGTLGVVGGQDVATFRTTAMPVSGSPYSITAVYGGDPDNVGSTSNVIEQSIDRDSTTTTASSSALTSNLGQTLTLTASVTANAPGSGTPTGSVNFYDTTTQTDLGSVPLVSGAAALPIATLPLGTQTITETYSGDTDFVPSIGTVSEVIAVPLDILNISSVSPTHTAVSTIDVTFSEPINTSSLSPGALTLTDDGGPNLINSGVSLTLVSGDTYAIGGLAG